MQRLYCLPTPAPGRPDTSTTSKCGGYSHWRKTLLRSRVCGDPCRCTRRSPAAFLLCWMRWVLLQQWHQTPDGTSVLLTAPLFRYVLQRSHSLRRGIRTLRFGSCPRLPPYLRMLRSRGSSSFSASPRIAALRSLPERKARISPDWPRRATPCSRAQDGTLKTMDCLAHRS